MRRWDGNDGGESGPLLGCALHGAFRLARAVAGVAAATGEYGVIGILLVAHAPFATALAAIAQHVFSHSHEPDVALTAVRALDVAPDVDFDAAVQQAKELQAAVDSGKGVLVLTDALGSTPGNVAVRLAEPGRVAVIAGVNLPMLLRALSNRGCDLAELAEKAVAGGQRGIEKVATAPTRQNQTAHLRGGQPGDDLARIHDQQ